MFFLPLEINELGHSCYGYAEQEASTRGDVIGLGIGLSALYDGGYGAQMLYAKQEYVPDGKGITYNYQSVIPGEKYSVDDNLILWLTKELKNDTSLEDGK